MDAIMTVVERNNVWVLEDAAKCIQPTYKGNALGNIGHLGAYSFPETKNISSGEGGALLFSEAESTSREDIIRQKETNRDEFLKGKANKYTWQDIGFSYLPSELTAAFLWAQLQNSHIISKQRLENWYRYHTMIEPLEAGGYLRRPVVPAPLST